MKKKFTNNIGLKIIALLVSFVFWLLVVNYDDPVIHNTYSGIPVEIVNQDALSRQGKVYEVLNGTDSISVTVYGTRSVLESISKEDIRAVADMEDLTLMDTISINLSTNKNFNQIESMKSDIQAVELSIEDRKEIHVPITVAVEGTPADGHIVGDISTNQNIATISGAESLIDQIAAVQAKIDVSGRSSDISTNVDLVLLNEEGNELDLRSKLTQNIRTVNVNVAILETKTIDVIYQTSGSVEDGYVIRGDVTSDRPTITIAGRSNVLSGISALEIPAAAINVEGKNETYSIVINLSKYLPDGVRFVANDDDGLATATIEIEKTVTRVLNIPMSNISLTNVPAGVNAKIYVDSTGLGEEDVDLSNVMVRVTTVGVSDAFENVSGSSVTGNVDYQAFLSSVDQTALNPGLYQMEITLNLPEGIHTEENYYATVQVMEQEQEE